MTSCRFLYAIYHFQYIKLLLKFITCFLLSQLLIVNCCIYYYSACKLSFTQSQYQNVICKRRQCCTKCQTVIEAEKRAWYICFRMELCLLHPVDSYVSFSKQSAIDEIKLLMLLITCFFLQLLHCELLHLLLLSL